MLHVKNEQKTHRKILLKKAVMRRCSLKTDRAVYILLILWLTVSGCQNKTYYHSYQSASIAGWQKNDTLIFSLPNAINPSDYEFEIGIRHKDTYKYRDLWLTINDDTLHLYLADSIGNWKGKGIGNTRQLTSPWKNKVYQDSIAEFRMIHIMKDSILHDIQDIGLQIKTHP